MAAGFGSGAAALLAVTFAVEGWRWPLEYFAVLTDGRVHPGADSMPNLHGLFAAVPGAGLSGGPGSRWLCCGGLADSA